MGFRLLPQPRDEAAQQLKSAAALDSASPRVRTSSPVRRRVSWSTHKLTWLTLTLSLPNYPKTTVLANRTLGALQHHELSRTTVSTHHLRGALPPW